MTTIVEQVMRGILWAAKEMKLQVVTPLVLWVRRWVGMSGEHVSNTPEIYQGWHDHYWPGSIFRHALGLGPESPFPESYTHMANVSANSLKQVFELTKDKGRMSDGPEDWQSWEENPGVEVLVMPCRSTSHGDVILDSQGEVHRIERQGFDYVKASQRVRYTLDDMLRVMAKARVRNRTRHESVEWRMMSREVTI